MTTPEPLTSSVQRVAARSRRAFAERPWLIRALRLLRLVVAGALMLVLVTRVEWGDVARIRPELVLLAGGALLLSYALSSLKWYLHVPGSMGIGPLRACRLYFEGLFWNNFLPSSVGGDAVKGWRAAGRPEDRVTAYLSILADRASSMLVMFTLGLIAVRAGIDVPLAIDLLLIAGWCAAVALFASMLLRSASLRHMRSVPRLVLAGLMGAGVQALQIGMNALVLVGVAGESHVLLLAAVIPVAAAISAVPISVNGLGLREGAVASLLVAGGVAAGDASLTVLVVLALTMLASAPGGLLHLASRRAAASAADARAIRTLVANDTRVDDDSEDLAA